jgi:2,3-diketo-5-methylthio-1-phosphopentane phosphatase
MCDFDGTITVQDTAEWLLDKHAEGDWRALDTQYVRGEIDLLECMRRQFSMISSSQDQMLSELEYAISVRAGFAEMVGSCSDKGAEVFIVSAGLDFVIQSFMRRLGVHSKVSVHSASTVVEDGRISIRFPSLAMSGSISFKDDIVRQKKAAGMSVVYIGDGVPDLEASALADHRFAVAGRRLESGLRARGLPFLSFNDFYEILPEIEEILDPD